MGGQMPEVCPTCRAFLVSGRPDCPFCGAEAAAAEAAAKAAIAAAPDPRTSAGAPTSWAAPGAAPRGPVPAPAPPRRSGGALKAIGIVAAVVALGALVAFMPDPGGRSNRSRSDAVAEPPDLVDELAGVCDGKPQPIKQAKAYKGGPGIHRVEAVMIPPGNHTQITDPDRVYLGEEDGWRSPDERADVDVADLELVGCYVVTGSRLIDNCEYDAFGTNNDNFWVPLATTWGRVVVREAKTGKEVLRQDVPEPQGAKCWGGASSSDTIQLEHPETAIRGVLRRVNDGTEPALPLADQAAKLCEHQVSRTTTPGDRPVDAVAVMVQSAHDGPFEPLGPSHRLALPSELRVVPIDQAGTVLCLMIDPERTHVPGMAFTLATGDEHGAGRVDAGQNAEGQLMLPWVDSLGRGLGFQLAQPRS